MRQKITLPFQTAADRVAAAHFLAALVRQSVGFTSIVSSDCPEIAGDAEITITFTGAY